MSVGAAGSAEACGNSHRAVGIPKLARSIRAWRHWWKPAAIRAGRGQVRNCGQSCAQASVAGGCPD
eukprot:12945551-Alexandrium_andersonii.AAC.1